MLLDWMLGAETWCNRRISIVHITPRGLKALANALDALAFPQATKLRIICCEVTDIGLRSLQPPLSKGALSNLSSTDPRGGEPNVHGRAVNLPVSSFYQSHALRDSEQGEVHREINIFLSIGRRI